MAQLLRHISKKVKASTMVEVLMASILIIVIFTIASLSLNNIFKSTIKSNTANIENELGKLQYLYQHKKINNSYRSDFGNWELFITKDKGNTTFFQAKNTKTQKIITKKLNNGAIE